MKYKELHPAEGKHQRLYCDECKGYLILSYDSFDDVVENIHIRLEGLPYLYCKKCNRKYLPDRSSFALIYAYEQAEKAGKEQVFVTRKKPYERFGYGNVEFIYDSDDYYFLPGLLRPERDGFLTPVFFNKAVLIKFDNWPNYRISLASKTYGTIIKDDSFYIPFGINSNKKVIMWLGDIASLPEEEQYYLRSENVPSDHDIGSEFYDGQIEIVFTEPSLEDALIKARSEMLEFFSKRFGKRISHLEESSLDLIENFNMPAVFSDKEMKNVIDILNKIFNESLDNVALGHILKERGIEAENLGSLKKFQKLLEVSYPGQKVYEIMSPFFVLYDLRVALLHLQPKENIINILSSARSKLKVQEDKNDYETLYKTLLERLKQSYDEIKKIVEKDNH